MAINESITRRNALAGATLGASAAALGGSTALAQSSARKTFVLVHGAWHGGWCWKRVAAGLRAAGHAVYTPTFTGLGERAHLLAPTIDLETHILDIVGVLECEELTDVAVARLEALKRTNDGFELADVDLELRGGGQLLGTRQSGLTDLRFAHLRKDRDLLERARVLADGLAERPGPLRDEADDRLDAPLDM